MKKQTTIFNKFLIAALAVFAINANAGTFPEGPTPPGGIYDCVIPKIQGDKVPFPRFQVEKANTRFDLADNETYILNGYVVLANGQYYFKVDFVTQPWLATAARIQNPYFPIDADASSMIRYANGQLVQMIVIARRASPQTTTLQSLSLVLPPVPYTSR